MTPKILLVNYSKEDAAWVEKNTGLKVLRGYMSEVEGHMLQPNGDKDPVIKFYSPEAYYECAMTFINLPASEQLKKEFDDVSQALDEDDQNNLLSYWGSKAQLLFIFVGKTNIRSFWPIGVPLNLKASSGNDTRKEMRIDDSHDLYEFFSTLEQQIKMPSERYIVSGMKPPKDRYSPDPYYTFGTHWHTYVSNANGDRLVSGLGKTTSDYHGENPGVILSPTPKKLATTTTKVIEFFGELFGIYTPGSDWQASSQFYPQAKLREYNKDIADIRSSADAEISSKQELVQKHLDEWGYLKNLVTEQSDALVDAVYKALKDVIGLDVTKSDDEDKDEPIEDLIVKIGERLISIEVKGTSKSNPPLEYTQQPFQHIIRRAYDKEKVVDAGLILNHDMKKDPRNRTDAYSDKDKEALLANLYFIDTRTLLDIAIAVIDGDISKEQAIAILFGKKGRITFK
jgi:hypothetical protein